MGYVGNHGYHEPVVNNGVNTFGFGGAPAAPVLPAFATVTEVQSAASSNYNGLLLSVKNQSKYVTLNFNYTYSHALDEVSNGGFLAFGINSLGEESPGNAIDPFNLALQNYGNADYDIRHSLNGNYLITVPYFGGPRLLTDNWQVGGTLFWHSGFPFSVVDSNVTDALEPNYGNLPTTWCLPTWSILQLPATAARRPRPLPASGVPQPPISRTPHRSVDSGETNSPGPVLQHGSIRAEGVQGSWFGIREGPGWRSGL